MSYKILVADDESNIMDVSKRYLEREGYQVVSAANGLEAIEKWKSEAPDLLVLDLMMPLKDGWEVCEEIRNQDDVPIIMLTARGEERDRIIGLTMGADDYMTKPFSPRELILRVKSILRRVYGRNQSGHSGKHLKYGQLEIDFGTRSVRSGGKPVELTAKEFDLLWVLASHPEQVFSRNQLLNHIWDIDYYGDTTTVTVHIRRLREKIEDEPSEPKFIKTIWGIGYKFEGRDQQ